MTLPTTPLWAGEEIAQRCWHLAQPHDCSTISNSNIQMYLYKFLNLFAQIAKYIRPNWKYISIKLQNMFVYSEVLTTRATIFVQQSQIQISSLQKRTRDQESLAAKVEGTFLLFKVITNLLSQLVWGNFNLVIQREHKSCVEANKLASLKSTLVRNYANWVTQQCRV